MQSTGSLIQKNVAVLKQGLEILNQLDDQVYPEVKHAFSAHGIGSHLRHCLDFYQAFLNGVEIGWIDYDNRQRDERIGRDRLTALQKIMEAIQGLERLSWLHEHTSLMVRLEDAGDELKTIDGTRIVSAEDTFAVLRRHRPGDTVNVVYVNRSGVERRGDIALVENPGVELVTIESTGGTLTPEQRTFRERWLSRK